MLANFNPTLIWELTNHFNHGLEIEIELMDLLISVIFNNRMYVVFRDKNSPRSWLYPDEHDSVCAHRYWGLLSLSFSWTSNLTFYGITPLWFERIQFSWEKLTIKATNLSNHIFIECCLIWDRVHGENISFSQRIYSSVQLNRPILVTIFVFTIGIIFFSLKCVIPYYYFSSLEWTSGGKLTANFLSSRIFYLLRVFAGTNYPPWRLRGLFPATQTHSLSETLVTYVWYSKRTAWWIIKYTAKTLIIH